LLSYSRQPNGLTLDDIDRNRVRQDALDRGESHPLQLFDALTNIVEVDGKNICAFRQFGLCEDLCFFDALQAGNVHRLDLETRRSPHVLDNGIRSIAHTHQNRESAGCEKGLPDFWPEF
jgi:hypothetical protein